MAGYDNKLVVMDLQGEFRGVKRVIDGETGCI